MSKAVRYQHSLSLPQIGYKQLPVLIVFLLIFSASLSFASSGISYHGKILKPDGVTPVSSATTQFRIQIRTPGSENCLLWEEQQTKDLSSSSGVFSITIADATEPTLIANTLPYNLERTFSNRKNFTGLTNCSIGTAYNPNPTDGRALAVFFREQPSDPWEQMPITTINFVPLALNSVQLEGYSSSEFLKIDPLSVYTPLSTADVTSLMDIIAGTSNQYLKPTTTFAGDVTGTAAATVVEKIRGTNVVATAPTNGQVLKFDGTNWAPAADATGGSPADASYAAKGVLQINTDLATSGLFIAGGVLAMPNVITAGGPTGTAQTVPVITYDQKGRLTAVSTATIDDTTKLPLAGGTMTGNIDMGTRDITNATNIAATNSSVRNLILNDNDVNTITVKSPADIAANYALTLPINDGAPGEVLSTDGSGVLSWVSSSAGSVTSVTSANNYLSIANTTTTPVITANVGTAANTLAAGDDARIVGALQKSVYDADVAPASLCTTSQTPYWSTIADTWLCQNISVSGLGGFVDGGNTFAATATLGTNSNHNLEIETNGTTKMTVTNGGNVGIGTTSPTAKLHVVGTNVASGNAADALYVVGGNTSDGSFKNGGLVYVSGGNSTAGGIGGAATFKAGNGYNFGGDTTISAGTGTQAGIGQGGTLYLNGGAGVSTGGNIAMAAGGTGLTGGSVSISGANGSITGGNVNIIAGNGTSSNGGDLTLDAGVGGATAGAVQIASSNSDNVQMVMGGGNVGIGTTSPATKLDVAGGVRIGTEATACAAGLAGTIRYNGGSVEYCNGSSWQAFGISGAALTSPLTTKGDLLTRDGTTHVRLPAGADGQVLTADSAQSSGLKWASPTAGTVTSVTSANSYLSIATTTTTPVITANVGTAANTLAAGDDARIVGALQKSVYDTDVAPAALCTTSQTPYWSTVADTWLCQNINAAATGAFVDGGNTFAATATLGTNSNHNLEIETNGTTKMTIEAGGNVGIGTTSPNALVDVRGSFAAGGLVTGANSATGLNAVALGSGVNATGSNSVATGYSGTAGGSASFVGNYLGQASGNNSAVFGEWNSTGSRGEFAIGVYGLNLGGNATTIVSTDPVFTIGNGTGSGARSNAMTVLKNGNTGIGVSAPTTVLDINGAITHRGIAAPALSPAGQGRIYFDSTSNTYKVSQNGAAYTDLVGGAGSGVTGSGTAGKIPKFSTGTALADSLITEATGKIGIGIATPSSEFEVNGNFGFTKGSDRTISVNSMTAGNGNSLTIQAGSTSAIGMNGGDLNLGAGAPRLIGGDGDGGNVFISGGPAAIAGTSGSVAISTEGGNDIAVPAGSISLTAGMNVAGGTGGSININAGAGGAGFDGIISLGDVMGKVGIGTTTPSTALDVNGAVTFRGLASPNVSKAGEGVIYYESTTNRFRVSQNGAGYADLMSASAVAGTTGKIAKFTGAGSVGDSIMTESTGRVAVAGQIYSTGSTNQTVNSPNISFNYGNALYVSGACTAFALSNMVDGGSYMLTVKGTSGTCTFTSGGDAIHYAGGVASVPITAHTIFSFLKQGSDVYVTWVTF